MQRHDRGAGRYYVPGVTRNPEADDLSAAPQIAGPVARFVPLQVAAALVTARVVLAPFADPDWRQVLWWAYGILAVAALAHVAAMRWPRRYTVNNLSWVLTIVALTAVVTLILAGDGR